MYINCTCIHTRFSRTIYWMCRTAPLHPRQRSIFESHSKLAYFLNFFSLSSFSLILFPSNNGILWV